jgi:hypothetical protein
MNSPESFSPKAPQAMERDTSAERRSRVSALAYGHNQSSLQNEARSGSRFKKRLARLTALIALVGVAAWVGGFLLGLGFVLGAAVALVGATSSYGAS